MDEKLRIAITALREIAALANRYECESAPRVATDALRDIQREHYLHVPSPVVAELIGARTL